jgi:hypothetical protein
MKHPPLASSPNDDSSLGPFTDLVEPQPARPSSPERLGSIPSNTARPSTGGAANECCTGYEKLSSEQLSQILTERRQRYLSAKMAYLKAEMEYREIKLYLESLD